jgi:hypothetical protein
MNEKENLMQDKCKPLVIDMVNLMNAITTLERRRNPAAQEAIAKVREQLKLVEKELEACEGL